MVDFFLAAVAVVFFLLEVFRVVPLAVVPVAEPVLVAVCSPVPVLAVEPVVEVFPEATVPPFRVFKTGAVDEEVVEVPVFLVEVLGAGPATAAVLFSEFFPVWLRAALSCFL